MAVMGNGFVPSNAIVTELASLYTPGTLHPQVAIRTQKGSWANQQEKTTAVSMWMMGFYQFPIVASTFGSMEQVGDCIIYKDMQTDQGECLIVELYERPPS